MAREQSLPEEPSAPHVLNALLVSAFVASFVFQFFVLPLLIRSRDPIWIWAVVPFLFINNTHWALIHEAIHGVLFSSRVINGCMGRLLGLTFGSPFVLLKYSHLMHHRHNRTDIERSEIWPPGSDPLQARLTFFFNLLCGLYLQELLFPLGSFLPQSWLKRHVPKLLKPNTYNGKIAEQLLRDDIFPVVRWDAALIYGLLAFSFSLYGWAYAWVPVCLLLVRAFFVSCLDYIYHYDSPLNDKLHGYNLELPSFLSLWILNFNFHGVHHRHPGLCWTQLPRAFRDQNLAFDASYWAGVVAQFQGPRMAGSPDSDDLRFA